VETPPFVNSADEICKQNGEYRSYPPTKLNGLPVIPVTDGHTTTPHIRLLMYDIKAVVARLRQGK
jgi:hypothetical protein